MKKRFSVFLVVLVLMSVFASNVLAAPADKKSVELISVIYERTGIILTFKTSGLTKSDLKNVSFEALSETKGISCDLLDDGTTVRCSVDKSLAGQGGFKVVIAGFIFWGDLPAEREVGCNEGEVPWYSADEYYYGEYSFSFEVPVWIWDEYAAMGGFEDDALYGITYEITGSFCAPDIDFMGPA